MLLALDKALWTHLFDHLEDKCFLSVQRPCSLEVCAVMDRIPQFAAMLTPAPFNVDC